MNEKLTIFGVVGILVVGVLYLQQFKAAREPIDWPGYPWLLPNGELAECVPIKAYGQDGPAFAKCVGGGISTISATASTSTTISGISFTPAVLLQAASPQPQQSKRFQFQQSWRMQFTNSFGTFCGVWAFHGDSVHGVMPPSSGYWIWYSFQPLGHPEPCQEPELIRKPLTAEPAR